MSKTINLEFGEQRRHSFLPECLDETRKVSKTIRYVEIQDDDDVFSRIQEATTYVHKPLHKFCTGSKYLGQWNYLGMAGKGVYKYPHGVIYDGHFNRNGEFHGPGILLYPNGETIEGEWRNGKLKPNPNFIAKGGIQMNEEYCKMPDRRFQVEIEDDLKPVGQEYLTNEVPPPREIPKRCYDLVSGYYDPGIAGVIAYTKEATTDEKKRIEENAQNLPDIFTGDEKRQKALKQVTEETKSEQSFEENLEQKIVVEKRYVIWIPSPMQSQWIVRHCRRAWDKATGYRPDMYEEWTKGTRQELQFNEDTDSEDEMHALNLSQVEPEKPVPTAKRFVSFVQNSKNVKDSVTVDILSKMFSKYTKMRSNMDLCISVTTLETTKEQNVLTL